MAQQKTDETKPRFDKFDYDKFFDCVHCGLCLGHCPTFVLLGDELDSPRGRIYLMKALADGKIEPTPNVLKHLDRCLDCRACETVCPSGVQYGSMIEMARAQINEHGLSSGEVKQQVHWLVRHVFPYPSRMEKMLLPLRLARKTGLMRFAERTGLIKLVPGGLGEMAQMLPPLPDPKIRKRFPELIPAQGQKRARVGLLTGCVTSVLYSPVNVATAQVLSKNGCEVLAPKNQVCCGALFAHTGEREEAKKCARRNIDVFEKLNLDAVIVNAAGCGATMKEYGKLLHDDPNYAERARAFVAKVKDFTEFLAALPPLPISHQTSDINGQRVTYHDPCHLCHGQKVTQQPRELICKIPGIEFVELQEADWCCGSAGIYNIAQPKLASEILERKLDNISATKADVVVTANPGCMVQLDYGIKKRRLKCQPLHIAQLLQKAYGE